MALSYEQQKDLNSKVMQTGESVLKTLVIYFLEGIKFVVHFIGDMVSQVIGK